MALVKRLLKKKGKSKKAPSDNRHLSWMATNPESSAERFLSAFEVKEDKPEAVVELIEELMAEVRGVAGTGHLILPDRLNQSKET